MYENTYMNAVTMKKEDMDLKETDLGVLEFDL